MQAQAAERTADGRGTHLRLVTTPDEGDAASSPRPAATKRELRELARAAAFLRRRARRLPEDSPVREELLETAEYFAATAEEL